MIVFRILRDESIAFQLNDGYVTATESTRVTAVAIVPPGVAKVG